MKRVRRIAFVILGLALLAQLPPFGGASQQAARAQSEIEIEGVPAQAAATATVNFAGLASESQSPSKEATATISSAIGHVEPPPNPPEPESEFKSSPPLRPGDTSKLAAPSSKSVAAGKSVESGGATAAGANNDLVTASAAGDTSRAPAASFTAQTDAGRHAPPDTSGAVGYYNVLSTHRSNYVVQDKATGAVISSVPMETFWGPTGATGTFNPRVLFDPYSYRWLMTAASNARSASSSILVAISQTHDPSGNYYLFRFDADAGDTMWADYPSIGFNKNWVAVSANLNNISNDTFNQGLVLAISHPNLRAGTAATTLFPGITSGQGGITMQPAVTYSWEEENEYLVSHIGSGARTYRVSWLEGTPTSPALFIGTQRVSDLGAWSQPGGETLPQAPDSTGAGTRKIDSSDSRVQKAVFRNGSIYYCQTVGLPAGRAPANIDRTAAQWSQVGTDGTFIQGGRVEDPGATPTNGGKWYAYPSLSVNRLGDVLMGFTEFSSAQFASAGYAMRAYDDPPGTMRLPHIYKAGEGHYDRALPGARNLWGLYSNAQVDPSNDSDLWTIQEYAAQPAGVGPTSGRWGTRWAKVVPPTADRIAFVSNRDGNDEIYSMESDGSHVRRLTNNPAQDSGPSWSPDRTRIAFTRLGANGRQIFTMNADGSNQQFLTQGMEPAWSPWGDYIAFVRDVDIWTHLVGDGEEINVTNNWGENSYYRPWISHYGCGDRKPSWSPDGETILFYGWLEDSRYIFTIPYWGGERTLIQNEDEVIGEPVWSPDGSKIAYWNHGRICTMNPDGEDNVCTTGFNQDYAPAWSPDGSKITFYTTRTGNYEVFSMNRDFTGAVNLTNSPASNEWSPGW